MGRVLKKSSARRRATSFAHGDMSLGSALGWLICNGAFHKPVKSGLPSAVRGAGAVRFGLPSVVRGIPGVGRFNHWAPTGIAKMAREIAVRKVRIQTSDFGANCSLGDSAKESGLICTTVS